MDLFKREPKQQEVQEPPEHSVALRLVVFLMAALCVGSSCYFSRVEPLIWVLFMVTVLTGSYLSYLYRNNDNKWLRRIAFIGIIAVGYLAGKRFLSPLSTEYDFVSPFVIFLAGVFSSLCFEMRSRSDLNLSSGLGLLLLCITAPVSRGLLYGGVVLSHILLGGLMLYFDCLSRTLNAWLDRKIEDAPMLDFAKSSGGRRRNRFGSTLGLLAFFPLLAAMMFLFMPRIDSFLDMTMAYAKTLNPDYVLDMAMGSQGPSSRPPQEKGQSARDWFQKNSQVLSDLKKNEKRDEKTREKIASTQPNQDKNSVSEPKKDKDKNKKSEKKKAKSDKEKGKTKESKDKDGKKEELNPVPQDKKKVDDGKQSSKNVVADKKEKSKQKKEKISDSKAASKQDKKPDSKEKSESKVGASSKSSKNKQGSKSTEKGKDSGGKSGSGGGGAGGDGGGDDGTIILGDDEKFDARRPYVTNNGLVLVVKARRLSYLRRQAYDHFDGKFWTKSDESPPQPKSKSKPQPQPKAKTVKVVDGEIKRDSLKEAMEKAAIARQAAPRAVVQQPASTASILMKSGPISKQEGIVMSQGGAGQNANAPVKTQPEPIPVDTAANSSDQYRDLVTRLSKGRTYEYLSRERPLFRVGLADALSVPPRYPSVSMTQEVLVKAKSIGRILPGAWIPKEVVIDQKEMSVDRYGVMKMSDEIKKDAKFKVQTELPIFNLAYMRQRPPLGANEEEVIRDNFAQYLQLPKSISENTFDIAESNTSPEFNWFVQSEQLAQYLRENYAYNYEADYLECDDMVNTFLEDQTGGQCTHFASTFVILNRCVGIPSRMVTGFAPGDLDQMTGERQVTGKNLHA
ncbi:MAG TPA: transglutaminaseTgpA domain-containing protein, partial [Candidatus Melainabacteria bacterium]|nr:transglutaminaseTgpA domain-containing protein [Candidatus Melainabacteria bacterium]